MIQTAMMFGLIAFLILDSVYLRCKIRQDIRELKAINARCGR